MKSAEEWWNGYQYPMPMVPYMKDIQKDALESAIVLIEDEVQSIVKFEEDFGSCWKPPPAYLGDLKNLSKKIRALIDGVEG